MEEGQAAVWMYKRRKMKRKKEELQKKQKGSIFHTKGTFFEQRPRSTN